MKRVGTVNKERLPSYVIHRRRRKSTRRADVGRKERKG